MRTWTWILPSLTSAETSVLGLNLAAARRDLSMKVQGCACLCCTARSPQAHCHLLHIKRQII